MILRAVVGKDCFIDVNVFEGDVELADDVSIGPGCVITNTHRYCTQVLPNTIVEGAEVGPCSLAHLPESDQEA